MGKSVVISAHKNAKILTLAISQDSHSPLLSRYAFAQRNHQISTLQNIYIFFKRTCLSEIDTEGFWSEMLKMPGICPTMIREKSEWGQETASQLKTGNRPRRGTAGLPALHVGLTPTADPTLPVSPALSHTQLCIISPSKRVFPPSHLEPPYFRQWHCPSPPT